MPVTASRNYQAGFFKTGVLNRMINVNIMSNREVKVFKHLKICCCFADFDPLCVQCIKLIRLYDEFSDGRSSTGAVYVYECPVAPLIPVYVMVLGIWTLLTTAVFFLPKLLCPGSSRPAVWTLVFIGLLLFFFSWFLFG